MTISNVHFIADETLGHGVRIDGKRYKLVERIAEVGENVLHFYEGESDGLIKTVNLVGATSVEIDEYLDSDGDTVTGYLHGNYYVLIPFEPFEEPLVTVDATQCSEAVLDMLANLACRVTELEKLAGMQRNENRLAHDRIEEVNDKAEMCIRDIAMLDERLIEIETPTQTPIEPETTQPHIFDLAKIKRFKLSDLDGKELRIHSASDSEGNITVTTTVAVDVNDGKMYVLESEVVEPRQAAEALLRKIAKLIEEEGGGI